MSWILDSSVAVKWIAPEVGQEAAIDLINEERELVAPEFILVEVGNIILKKVRRGELSRGQGNEGIGLIRRVVQRLVPDELLADRALAIALDTDHPVYDCLYVACAEHADGTVVTADERLVNKFAARFSGKLQLLGAT
jgi:predicted nucleic acid-binding protein